ncbi:MAG: hypothetical protein OXB91_12595 [Bryobacterales bacterium]|nr:hypothetical protein [Bryobacterales bacterium]
MAPATWELPALLAAQWQRELAGEKFNTIRESLLPPDWVAWASVLDT